MPEKANKRAAAKPLAPARYKVELTASAELRETLKRLEALMPGHDLAAVIQAAVIESWTPYRGPSASGRRPWLCSHRRPLGARRAYKIAPS